MEDDADIDLEGILKLLSGGTFDLVKMFPKSALEEKTSISFKTTKEEDFTEVLGKLDDEAQVLIAIRNIYDWAVLDDVLKGNEYISVGKVNVYETFIQGAKEGFDIAVRIIPYLVAMLVAIAVLRASGVLNIIVLGFENFFNFIGINTDFVPALPTAILKPLSGSGARAMMIETMQTYGADSFPAFVSAVVQGSTETTFYVLAVYFGAVKITKIRSALPCSLWADFVGITSAIILAYLFY